MDLGNGKRMLTQPLLIHMKVNTNMTKNAEKDDMNGHQVTFIQVILKMMRGMVRVK